MAQIIGNTYVGGNAVDEQLSRSFQSAGANLGANVRQGRDRRAQQADNAFKTLDEDLNAMWGQYGPQMFDEQITLADGTVMDNPYGKAARAQLEGAANEYARSTGGKPEDYINGFRDKPYSPDQQQSWLYNIDMIAKGLKREQPGQFNYPEPPQDTPYGAQPAPPSAPGPQPQPPAPQPQAEVDKRHLHPQVTSPAPAGPVPRPQESITAWGGRPTEDPASGPIGAAATAMGKVLWDATGGALARAGKGFVGELARTGVTAAYETARGKLLDGWALAKSPEDKMAVADQYIAATTHPDGKRPEGHMDAGTAALVDAFKLKRDPSIAEAIVQHLAKPAAGSTAQAYSSDAGSSPFAAGLPQDKAANELPATEMLRENKARGTGQPSMSPQELAQHEAKTGDVHFPALIGVKEGVVNANAMDHGGQDIVRMLNESYPVFAEGYQGLPPGMVAEPPAEDAMTQMVRRDAEAQAMAAQQAPMPPEPTPMHDEETVPQAAPSNQPPSLMGELKKVLGPTPKKSEIEQNAEMNKLRLEQIKAESQALPGKAMAVTQRLLKKERDYVLGEVNSPEYTKYQTAMFAGLREFYKTATPEELAFYGMKDVLASKATSLAQQAQAHEEKKYGLDGPVDRDYKVALAAQAHAGARESDARTEYYNAQKALEDLKLQQEQLKIEGGDLFNLETSMDMVKATLSKHSDNPDFPLDELLKQQPALKQAFDNVAVSITGDRKAQWLTSPHKDAWWISLGKFFKLVPQGSQIGAADAPAGPSGGPAPSRDQAIMDELRAQFQQ